MHVLHSFTFIDSGLVKHCQPIDPVTELKTQIEQAKAVKVYLSSYYYGIKF